MKILLVNTPIWKVTGFRSAYNPGMGLLYIGAVLREQGNDVRIIDAEAMGWWFEEIVHECKSGGFTHVGIGSLSNGLPIAIELCDRLKKEIPNLWVVLGGVGPSAEPDKARLSAADSICIGEGELIAGRVFKERGVFYGETVKDMDSLPSPAYDLLEPCIGSERWSGNLPRPPINNTHETVVMWSRGCPHNCSFCSKATMKRGKPRTRSPKKISEELIMLHEVYGINSVFVYDDELIGMGNEHEKWLTEISDELATWNLDEHFNPLVWLKGQGRCSEKFITEDTGRILKDAGFFAMMLGCESGSEKVKNRIKKGTTNQDIRHTLDIISKWVDIYGFWMVGMPEEVEDDIRETERLIIETAKYMKWLQVTVFSPLPGSDFWDEAIEKKWLSEDFNGTTNFQVAGMLNMPWLDSETIQKWQTRLNMAYAWSKKGDAVG